MNAKTRKLTETLSPAELKNYIERGILDVHMTNGKIPTRIEETPEYKRFKDLKGKAIHIGDASRKYNIPDRTISRWKQKGFIKVLHQEGQKIFVDESYVAYCAYVYRKEPGQGKWAFNKDGTPRPEGVELRE